MDTIHTAIIHAARIGEVPVLKELASQDTNFNFKDEKGYTPLIIACYNNRYEAAKVLIDAGADINAADFGGNTALMGVCFKGYTDIAQLLINEGFIDDHPLHMPHNWKKTHAQGYNYHCECFTQ